MPYKIQHKSQNSCLIKYVKDKRSRRKKRYDLALLVFFVIALMIGVDLILAGAMWFAARIVLGWLQPPYVNFEIELNRQKNRIYIRNSDQPRAKVTTYPLTDFNGFGVREQEHLQAELFLKLEATQGGFQKVLVQKNEYPVPRKNAEKIVEAVDEWLRLSDDTQSIEAAITPNEPMQEKEIFRDFRDMD